MVPGKIYTTGELASLSGVSVRTLHYYEEIGLLVPQRSENNYRSFQKEDVVRLQQILLYRACGMSLADIGDMLKNTNFNEETALENHLVQLHKQQEELAAIIANAENTLAALKGKHTMTDTQRFEGLKKSIVQDNEVCYGKEARQAYGDAAVDASKKKILSMDEKEWNDTQKLEEDIKIALRAALAEGNVQSEQAHELCRMHARWLTLQWGEGTYSPEAHAALAEGYVADPRFSAYYDNACGEGAAVFLRDALVAWCSKK